MKIYLFLLIALFATICCKKESIDPISKEAIIGKWVNQSDNKDTLLITDTLIYRTHLATNTLIHYYSFELNNDSIKLRYLGIDKVNFINPFVHKIELSSDKKVLKIKNFKNVYPGYDGESFNKIIK
jgi:hypothetical protein